MSCSTRKNSYYTEEEVQEALIRSHIRFVKAAQNYYLCTDCGEYHLTSQGELHPILNDPEVQERIKREQRSQEWEGRLR
jgi:molybdenum cofactor biosynthesis enzyme MoaA